MTKMKNDNELIRQYQAGSIAAYNELVRRYLNDTFRFFVKLTNDEMDAEDLAQDVFLKLHKSLKKFRFESEFKTYLYRVNVNTANNYLQRNKWRKWLHLDEVPVQVDDSPTVEKNWIKQEVWDAIAKLPKTQRMVVTMRIAQSMPHKDIAEVMGISENSVKASYHYGINQLKQKFNENTNGLRAKYSKSI
jgi:RNA polymerase sigma-70 factor (ECF subfamily)